MAKVAMQKLRICAVQADRKSILDRLQYIGLVEPERVEPGGFLQNPDTSQARAKFENIINSVTSALEILDKYAPQKSGLLDSFAARPGITGEQFEQVLAKSERDIKRCAEIVRKKKQIDELRAENVRLRMRIEALEPWLELDIPMRFKGTAKTAAMIGYIPQPTSEERLLEQIAEAAPQLDAVHLEVISVSQEMTCLAAMALKKDMELLETALRSVGFSRPVEMSKKSPVECSKELEGRIKEREDEIERLEKFIESQAEHRQEIQYLLDYYTMRLEKYEVLENIGSSRNVFIIEGWIPKPAYDKVAEELSAMGAYCEPLEPNPGDDPPVVLKNIGFTEPVEPVLAMYSLPSKNDVDPTSIMAVFYYILFGIMLGDAAYGLIMIAATLFVLLKYKPEGDKRKNMKMFMFSGASSVIWGFVFGSFFGDLINVVAQTFFGVPEGVNVFNPIWFDPIKNPLNMMIFSVAIGVVHVLSGLVMGIVTAAHNRDIKAALFDYASWLLLLISAICWGLIAVMGIAVPDFVNTALLAVMGVCVVAIIAMSGRDSKSPAKRILKGVYALYNVTGYLSDFMSYSRLLALGLATGVISQVFNKMASMVGGGLGGVFGGLLMLIICVIGHLFNIGISLIGCYVHTNRLEYVEFFGKFFEGGGRQFKPFAARTKYFKFKEEN